MALTPETIAEAKRVKARADAEARLEAARQELAEAEAAFEAAQS